jgi:Cu/Ag efflux pump CusA
MPQFIHQSRESSGPPRMSDQVLHNIQEHIPLKVNKIHDRKELQENTIKNPFHNLRNDILVALNSKYISRSSN